MYCRKCGKQINYDAQVCMECEEEEKMLQKINGDSSIAGSTSSPEQRSKERMMFFGKALASTIVGTIVFIIGLVALTLITEVYDRPYISEYVYADTVATSIVLMFMSIGGAIPGLILGVSSVKCFCTAKQENRAKPIATLVCGLVGLVCSAMTLIYATLTFFMCVL